MCTNQHLMSTWNYLMRVVPDLGNKLQPIEEALRFRLLPAITGRSNISDAERHVFALPARRESSTLSMALSYP